MNGENRLLLERLMELAQDKQQLSEELLDQLKARFMAITSSSPDTLAALERLGYGTPPLEDEAQPEDGERSGLLLPESGLLLSEFLEQLAELPASPVEQAGLSHADFRAGVTALWTIMRALEWSSFDAQHIAQYTPDKATSLLNALVRSLRSYRRTGEP
ncbi:MAG TPA: hypothetical protein VFZ61_22300 [Polyangiales bacterium]